MFFIMRFIIVWTVWFVLADKKRWRELLVVGILAGFIGSTTDNIMTYYKLWDYHDPHQPVLSPILPKVLDDWGVYIVVTYLFIQFLPKEKTFSKLFLYWFLWSGLTIFIEWIHVVTGHMEHHKWWTYGYSYIADWILFWLFYQFHKVFRLEKLSEKQR